MNVLTARLKNDEKKAELQESKIDTSISQNVLTAAVKKNEQQAQLNRKNLSVSVSEKINVIQNVDGVVDHDKLNNLDYEHSGHIGFASSEQVKLCLSKDLSVLPKNNLQNRNAKIYLYDDMLSVKETQTTIQELLDAKIKTVSSVPDNLQNGDYIFLEVK